NAGYPVVWLDVNAEMLEKGLVEIDSVYKRSVAQQRFDDAEAKARLARISTTQNYADLHDLDLVVEAVYENMDLKKTIFGELDKAVKPSAILATNTSYQIGRASCREREQSTGAGRHTNSKTR